MSDSPTGVPENTDNPVAESAPDVDAEPIDVNDLLESTRKLFEPEDIERAMAQAGYAPEPDPSESDRPAVDNAMVGDNSVSDQPVNESVEDGDSSARQPASAHPESQPVTDDTDSTARKGLNILSVVSLILALTLSPLALIFGYIALGQLRRANQRGEALALWAIGLGWVVFAAWMVLIGSLVWIGWQQGITLDALSELVELFTLP